MPLRADIQYCAEISKDEDYIITDHELFHIETPANWNIDQKLKKGMAISARSFPDSNQRNFMLSVMPYQDYYFKKNGRINYFKFETGIYKNYKAIYLVRNDLQKRATDNSAYWRAELKILNKKENMIYHIAIGKRNSLNTIPEWCEFQRIVESFKINE